MKITSQFLRSFIALCLLCTDICACGKTDADADKNTTDTTPQTDVETLDHDVFYVKSEAFISYMESLEECINDIHDHDLIVVGVAEEIGEAFLPEDVVIYETMWDRDKYYATLEIRTPITFRITEVLGSVQDLSYSVGDAITIYQFYGQVDKYCNCLLEGEEELKQGEEYILYLRHRGDNIFTIFPQESIQIKKDGTLLSLLHNIMLYADCEDKEDAIAKIKAILNAQ